jgi:hypothetical protein
MIINKSTTLFTVVIFFANAAIAQQKRAAITECIMLDHSLVYNNDNSRAPGIFELLARDQERALLDSIISKLSHRYSIGETKVFQKDSIAFSNSSMKGIGKLRENDRKLLNGENFDYYIKIYSDYTLSNAMVLGMNIMNTIWAKLTLYIAVFDSSGKRTWFPDSVIKDGISIGSGNVNTYYNSNDERARIYLVFFNQAIAEIFK